MSNHRSCSWWPMVSDYGGENEYEEFCQLPSVTGLRCSTLSAGTRYRSRILHPSPLLQSDPSRIGALPVRRRNGYVSLLGNDLHVVTGSADEKTYMHQLNRYLLLPGVASPSIGLQQWSESCARSYFGRLLFLQFLVMIK